MGQKSAHDEIIEKRKAKLQQKLDSRQKAKESKEAEEEEAKPEEVEKPKHFLKRNLKKTRSRQKNKRKDNRSQEVKDKKFGSILNVWPPLHRLINKLLSKFNESKFKFTSTVLALEIKFVIAGVLHHLLE